MSNNGRVCVFYLRIREANNFITFVPCIALKKIPESTIFDSKNLFLLSFVLKKYSPIDVNVIELMQIRSFST